MTPICKECQTRVCQTNYIKNGVKHYRSKCYNCAHSRKKGTVSDTVPGYKKRERCERCGFIPKILDQLKMHYADHNMQNTNFKNLKTVCANCSIELLALHMPWVTGDLAPDF